MQCRICASREVKALGRVEYYPDYGWSVFDCLACSCRFTQHDASIYNWLHSNSGSIYGLYRDLAEQSKRLFDQGDLAALKRELCATAKYRFIIDSVEQQSTGVKLLEIGCSRGYLTSYFILAGYDIVGADVSPDAINAAREAFGAHFVCAHSTTLQKDATYDVIYHVGTIGCVDDPLGLTNDLLKMLKPGGQLLFNAPNADSCWLKGQLWLDAAPPPDLVTLFRPGFWQKHLSSAAVVEEEIEMCPPDQAFCIGLRKVSRRRWPKPDPLPLDESVNHYQNGRPGNLSWSDRIWQRFEHNSLKIVRLTHLLTLAPSQPSPFGLFVKMTKKCAQ